MTRFHMFSYTICSFKLDGMSFSFRDDRSHVLPIGIEEELIPWRSAGRAPASASVRPAAGRRPPFFPSGTVSRKLLGLASDPACL